MYGRILSRIAVVAATVGGAAAFVAPSAQAATTTHYPTAANARTFTVNDGGWTSTNTNNGLCVVVCQMQSGSWVNTGGADGAGDGFQRASFSSGVGVAVDQTVTFTSPQFTVTGTVDSATLSADFRTQLGLLGTILSGSAKVTPRLIDVTHNNDSTTLATQTLPGNTAFGAASFAVPAGALVTGRDYKLSFSVNVTALAAAVLTTGNVDLDNVSLDVVDLDPPSNLTANVNTSSGLQICGTVDPHGMSTTVTVQYGATSAYGATSTSAIVTGSGPQAYCIPLVNLTPGAVYHYRVYAINADGEAYTTDYTFTVAPVVGYGPPVIRGFWYDRYRTVVYDVVPGTTSVRVEILLADGVTIYSTTTDADRDGEVVIQLPNVDGRYFIRVIRIVGGVTYISGGTNVELDRVAPLNAGAPEVTGLVSVRARHVHFVRASDAVTAYIEVVYNGGVVNTWDVTSGGDVDITLPDNDAFYVIRVVQLDAAGNAATSPNTTVQLARGTRGTGGEDTPAPTPPTGGGGTTPPTGTTTTTVNGDPGGWSGVLTSCYGNTKLAVTDIRAVGKKVSFSGIAALASGTGVSIVDAAGKTVATAKVGADGRFAAVAAKPKSKTLRKARYVAVAGNDRSAALKFTRIAVVNSMTVSGTTATLSGKLDPRALKGKKGFKIAARGGRGATACAVLGGGKLAVVGKAKLNTKTGKFSVKVKVPGTGRVAVRVAFSGGVKTATLYSVR